MEEVWTLPEGTLEVHSVPAAVLAIKALDALRASAAARSGAAPHAWPASPAACVPSSPEEEEAFRAELQALSPGSDFHGSLSEALAMPSRMRQEAIPWGLRQVLKAAPPPAGEPRPAHNAAFWTVAAALRDFAEAHSGFLPKTGALEDMDAHSAAYTSLQKCYSAQAEEDAAWVKRRVAELGAAAAAAAAAPAPPPAEDYAAALSRCAAGLAVQRWGTLEEELCGEPMVDKLREGLEEVVGELPTAGAAMVAAAAGAAGGGEVDDTLKEVRAFKVARVHPVLWYLVLRAADRFQAAHQGRWPGTGGSGSNDGEGLWAAVQALSAEMGLELPPAPLFSQAHAAEVCRYAACEPHCTAALVGGLAAQEALKILTLQHIPARLVVYSGVAGYGWNAGGPRLLGE